MIPNVSEAQVLFSKSILRQTRQAQTIIFSQGNLKYQINDSASPQGIVLSWTGHPRDTRSTQGITRYNLLLPFH